MTFYVLYLSILKIVFYLLPYLFQQVVLLYPIYHIFDYKIYIFPKFPASCLYKQLAKLPSRPQ